MAPHPRAGPPSEPEVVLGGTTIDAVAHSSTLDELAVVKRIGPFKLEQYGDELLAIVAEASEDTADPAGAMIPKH